MNYRHASAVIALALGLAGCAGTSSSTRSDVRYEDGSYYSPVDDGNGDYYYAPEPRYDNYDYYNHSFFYGPPFGYSPFFDPYQGFGFSIFFGGYGSNGNYGWYDPFWGRPGYHHGAPYDGHRHDHARPPNVVHAPPPQGDSDDATVDSGIAPRHESRRPRPKPDPMLDDDSADAWVPLMPVPATSTARSPAPPAIPGSMPARPEPRRRDFPAPEPRAQPQPQRNDSTALSEVSDTSETDNSARRRSNRRGDEHPQQ